MQHYTSAVTLRQFLAEVGQLVARFPNGSHLLNMCSDRYRFSVGLAAAIVAGKVSLLPPAHTPEVVRQMKVFAPDVFCLTDRDLGTGDLPQLKYPVMDVGLPDEFSIPQIAAGQRIAVVFTSGSTGIPQPHPKTWRALVSSVQAGALRLGLLHNSPCTLVGTVPPQHMYGLESTVLMAWQSGNALSQAQPFYPDDICRALAAVPTPRVLVSSPVHLRALLDAGLALPEIARVVSATAPLSAQLAQDIEARCNAPLVEIYGSTETGVIATRHPTQGAEWQLLPGIKLVAEGDCMRACGGHVETPIAMNDIIEPITAERFLLHGRTTDLINIAGKRHSLASLDHLLNALPGVVDGAFYMPDETGHDKVTRLAACVVAPGMAAATLLAALREHIDPVFLPRPLLLVDELPRNRTGKLPRAALQALLQTHSTRNTHDDQPPTLANPARCPPQGGAFPLGAARRGNDQPPTLANPARCPPQGGTFPLGAARRGNNVTHWTVPLDHPAFAGHFPGTPILPGVVLLDIALQTIADSRGIALDLCAISSVKFLGPARPGEELLIQHSISASGTIGFEILAGMRKIASGSIAPGAPL